MLLSWIENEEQKQFWSGNTFKDGVNEEIFLNHLARKDVHSHCYLGETNTLIAYGEIVYSDLSKGVLLSGDSKTKCEEGWHREKLHSRFVKLGFS